MPKPSTPLPEVACPICRSRIFPKDGSVRAATKYSECLRRCEKCGVGFANGINNPTLIYLNSEHNVPEQIREGTRQSLEQALNKQHRADKISKFGFSTSEDALTWTVFQHLRNSGQLWTALHSCVIIGSQSGDSALLL